MIIVIGAGPAGLATAYRLQQRGWPYCVLEKDEVGSTWSNQYEGLHLHTLKAVSALPGLPMPEDYPAFPSATQVHAYLQAYARHFQLNIETGVEVLAATYAAGNGAEKWRLETNREPFEADIVMAATGIWSTPHCPHFEGQARFQGRILHANDYHNARPFAGQRVLVVGVGNSGSEIAVQLSEQGVTSAIAVRSGVDFVPYPTSALAMNGLAWFFRTAPRPVGEWLLSAVRKDFTHLGLPPASGQHIDAYPVVGYELPEAVAAGQVTVYPGLDRFAGPETICFVDGQQADFDAVILATGYRPTLDFLDGQLDFDEDGSPRLDACWRSTRNPHLYCIGFHYPATAGWLQSIGRVTGEAVRCLQEITHPIDRPER